MANLEITTATSQDISGIQEALKLNVPVLTEYPTTDATKAGQEFIFRGQKWRYLTQEEIDENSNIYPSSFVEGKPLPIEFRSSGTSTITNTSNNMFSPIDQISRYAHTEIALASNSFSYNDNTSIGLNPDLVECDIDFNLSIDSLFLINCSVYGGYARHNAGTPTIVNSIKGGDLLRRIRNFGTGGAFSLWYLTIDASILDDFFTQLPTTTLTADLNFNSYCTIIGTPDTSIATSKGYTVVLPPQ